MIVSKLIIQTLYTALFQFKCCDSSIDLDEISLPSSTVIEGLLQEHPSLLSLSDVQEAVSVSKSTQECLKPEPEPVFQVTEKVVKTGPRKGNTEQKVTLGKWYNSLHLQWLPECWRLSISSCLRLKWRRSWPVQANSDTRQWWTCLLGDVRSSPSQGGLGWNVWGSAERTIQKFTEYLRRNKKSFHCEPTTRPPFRQSLSLSFYLVRTIKTFQQWWRTPELSNRDFSSSRLTELTEEDLSSIQFGIADSQSNIIMLFSPKNSYLSFSLHNSISVMASVEPPVKRKRGRPPGRKNKNKMVETSKPSRARSGERKSSCCKLDGW